MTFLMRNDPELVGDMILKRMSIFIHHNDNIMSSKPLFQQEQEENPLNIEMTQNMFTSKKESEIESKDFYYKLMHLIYAAGEIALKFVFYFEKTD